MGTSSYYSNWREEPFGCSKCGWRGLGKELATGEAFRDLFEVECPQCAERLGTVTYPTFAESRANWDKVSPADRIIVELAEAGATDLARRQLRSPDQLPDLPGEQLVLSWDQTDGNDTVIKCGEQVLWQEPALFDGHTRYIEVAEILFQKYGERLGDLAPTVASELYLYGDALGAPNAVKQCRERLRSRQEPDS